GDLCGSAGCRERRTEALRASHPTTRAFCRGQDSRAAKRALLDQREASICERETRSGGGLNPATADRGGDRRTRDPRGESGTRNRRPGIPRRRGLQKMEGPLSEASVPATQRRGAVRRNASDLSNESGDIMLKLLHTADWHLGRRFPSFPDEAQKKLSRARMDVVTSILDVARRNAVHAILCPGDIFDDPQPAPDFWEELARTIREHPVGQVPIFFVPGNHDPLTPESVWAPAHPFRSRLPKWVHVVDRDDFSYELSKDAILYARPCRSKAGETDL